MHCADVVLHRPSVLHGQLHVAGLDIMNGGINSSEIGSFEVKYLGKNKLPKWIFCDVLVKLVNWGDSLRSGRHDLL